MIAWKGRIMLDQSTIENAPRSQKFEAFKRILIIENEKN